jgi:predicted 3-demethylubiquinone-9 3-methyltransferase (glyoxalase superfamily)
MAREQSQMSKISTCLWFGRDAETAIRFYVSLVPVSA